MKKLKKSNFLEGAFIATLCIIITKIIGVVYVIPFYKIIGEQGGTLYGYAYNIYNVFLIISAAGIPLAISKLTSEYNTLNMQDKKARMYEIATKAIMTFSILSFAICFIFAPQLSNLIIGELEGGNTIEDVSFVIRVISFALLVVPFLSIERGYLQGHRYINEPSISQVIEQIVRIAVILIGSYLCIYTFELGTKYAVGISVFAATLGGIATYIYLHNTVKKNKKQLSIDIKPKVSKKEDKEIIKKIIFYSIPFVIISLSNTIYTSTDMILMIKTLPKLGFSAPDTEFISSVFTTWGVKFHTIITSIPSGLIISLIPNMVKDYTEKNMHAVNSNFNKCLKIIMLIIAPLAIFLSGMSESLWNAFYGANVYGPSIIRYTLIVTILDCLYIVNNSLLQSLNKPKVIYTSVISGIILNLVLDIPLMHLFSHIGLPAYHGAITATLIGTLLSNMISIIYLKKHMQFNYKETIKSIPRFILSILILIPMIYIFNKILPSGGRIIQIMNLAISGVACGGVYLLINFKHIKVLLPEKILKKLKLTD